MNIPDGYVKTEDLVVGDEVAYEGEWRFVNGLRHIAGDGYSVAFSDHTGTTTSSGRLWRLKPADWRPG